MKELIRKEFATFFRAFPPRTDDPRGYLYGRHTHDIIRRVQAAYDRMLAGHSSYICLCVPIRHGKSDITTRRFPVWFHLNNPESEIVVAGHSDDFITKLGLDARDCLEKVAPLWDLEPDRIQYSRNDWGVKGHGGQVHVRGMMSGITGLGAKLAVIDDPYKTQQDADSEIVRETIWETFKGDIVSRQLAPNTITIVTMSRRHELDIVGQIEKRNNPNSEDYDPNFPVFDIIKYPGQSEEFITEKNPKGWLFPERISDEKYEETRSIMGHLWDALSLQDPSPKRGLIWKTSNIVYINDQDSLPKNLRWVRGWDLASTLKQKGKEDPDRTVGILAAYDAQSNTLYVRDAIFGRWEAGKRDDMIVKAALRDKENGISSKVRIEAVGSYVDAFTRIRDRLAGHVIAEKVVPDREKLVRAEALEPLFETSRVTLLKAPWNDFVTKEWRSFPGGAHDDCVDALVIAVGQDITPRAGLSTFPMLRRNVHLMEVDPIITFHPEDSYLTIPGYDDAQGNPIAIPIQAIRSIDHSSALGTSCLWAAVSRDESLDWFIYRSMITPNVPISAAAGLIHDAGPNEIMRYQFFDSTEREPSGMYQPAHTIRDWRSPDGIRPFGACMAGLSKNQIGPQARKNSIDVISSMLSSTLAIESPKDYYFERSGMNEGQIEDLINHSSIYIAPSASLLYDQMEVSKFKARPDPSLDVKDETQDQPLQLIDCLRYAIAGSGWVKNRRNIQFSE